MESDNQPYRQNAFSQSIGLFYRDSQLACHALHSHSITQSLPIIHPLPSYRYCGSPHNSFSYECNHLGLISFFLAHFIFLFLPQNVPRDYRVNVITLFSIKQGCQSRILTAMCEDSHFNLTVIHRHEATPCSTFKTTSNWNTTLSQPFYTLLSIIIQVIVIIKNNNCQPIITLLVSFHSHFRQGLHIRIGRG